MSFKMLLVAFNSKFRYQRIHVSANKQHIISLFISSQQLPGISATTAPYKSTQRT